MTVMVENAQFRSAMSRLGAAVNIITTDGPVGRHGMTASAVCSVTDDPASLLVCINRSARINAMIWQNGFLCVNVLSAEHQDLSALFANRNVPVEERFAAAEWQTLSSGVPALVGALCNFGCRVESVHQMGTHSVFFCQVEDLHHRDGGDGLVYFDRSYHRLPRLATV